MTKIAKETLDRINKKVPGWFSVEDYYNKETRAYYIFEKVRIHIDGAGTKFVVSDKVFSFEKGYRAESYYTVIPAITAANLGSLTNNQLVPYHISEQDCREVVKRLFVTRMLSR